MMNFVPIWMQSFELVMEVTLFSYTSKNVKRKGFFRKNAKNFRKLNFKPQINADKYGCFLIISYLHISAFICG